MLSLNLATLVYLALAASQALILDGKPLFTLEASVVTAIEGGPIVVKATLKFTGPHPITFDCPEPERCFNPIVRGPKSWSPDSTFSRAGFSVGPREAIPDRCTLKSNTTLSHYLRVHRDYENAPVGAAKLKLTWSVLHARAVLGKEKEKRNSVAGSEQSWNVRLEKTIDVSVEANTRDAMRKLCERLMGELEKGTDRIDTSKMVWAHLDDSKPRQEFLPIAIGLLDVDEQPIHALWYIYKQLPNDRDGNTTAVGDYLSRKHPLGFVSVFDFWERYQPQHSPSREQVVALFGRAQNTWVKALLSAKFGDYLTKRDHGQAKSAVTKAVWSEPSQDFNRLLAQLGDDDFRVRESASKAMASMDEDAEPMICTALSKQKSAEVIERLRKVLDVVVKKNPNSQSLRAVAAIGRIKSPEAKDLLQALAEGPMDLRCSQLARELVGPGPKK